MTISECVGSRCTGRVTGAKFYCVSCRKHRRANGLDRAPRTRGAVGRSKQPAGEWNGSTDNAAKRAEDSA